MVPRITLLGFLLPWLLLSVACAADGVLLRDTSEAQEVAGVTWLRVVTPAGVEGWSSAAFLER